MQNQIEVVDQERIRAKRLRKERDIHEATAMGARDKERKLETELQRERTAREREIATLKDVLEREVAQKRNLQETINKRNTEFDVLYEELQRLKDYKSSESPQVETRYF